MAKARNLEVKGIVNVKAEQIEPTKKKFSKAIEDGLLNTIKKKHHKLSKKGAKELAHKNHLPNWKK